MKRPILLAGGAILALAVLHAPLQAEEGMWTFDNPPTRLVQDKYNFTITQQWLDHVRLSSVRLNDGGSGSFVSPTGLLLTNHHVALGQLQKNSTPEHDYVKSGFYARTPEEEIKSPDLEVNVLVSMENVTARVQDALKGARNAEQEFAKRKDAIAAIERESLEKTGLRSDVITLYQGGEYWLYRYKKYTDVRIVFAPEQQIAFFGGDPDNFTYPRYDLDFALFRVYENGRPIQSQNYLKWNPKGAADGELVFVSGNPGSTQRSDTLAQLEAERDLYEPAILKILHSRIDSLKKYAATGAEADRRATDADLRLGEFAESVRWPRKGPAGQARDGCQARRRDQVPGPGDGQSAMEGGLRQCLGPDRRGRKEGPDALQGAVFSRPELVAGEPGAADRAIRRRDQEAGRRAPGRLSRIAARIAAAAAVLSRADLSRHGNRAHHGRPGAGSGGSRAQTIPG